MAFQKAAMPALAQYRLFQSLAGGAREVWYLHEALMVSARAPLSSCLGHEVLRLCTAQSVCQLVQKRCCGNLRSEALSLAGSKAALHGLCCLSS